MTLMSESIRLAAEDFTFLPERRNVIVLISDGIETCGDAPAEVVLRLQELGVDYNIHVIGLNVDAATRSQLSRISDVADGVFFRCSCILFRGTWLQQTFQRSRIC